MSWWDAVLRLLYKKASTDPPVEWGNIIPTPLSTMPFRLSAKHLLLTYPQTEFDKNALLAFLQSKLSRWQPTFILVAGERHADGQPHRHAYVRLRNRCDIRDQHFLDFSECHGNYQAARKPDCALQYCRKDGDFVEWGDPVGGDDSLGWSDIIASATNADEFTELAIQHRPRDAVLSLERIQYFARFRYAPKRDEYTPQFTTFDVPADLQRWVVEALETPTDRPVSLLLIGHSRLGKTEWARSLFNHMYFCGMINLDEWDDDARYMVLDDFDWKFVPSKKQLIGAQKQVVLTDKYRKKTTVKWGKPVIYLCNPDCNPYNDMSSLERRWYDANWTVYFLNKALF